MLRRDSIERRVPAEKKVVRFASKNETRLIKGIPDLSYSDLRNICTHYKHLYPDPPSCKASRDDLLEWVRKRGLLFVKVPEGKVTNHTSKLAGVREFAASPISKKKGPEGTGVREFAASPTSKKKGPKYTAALTYGELRSLCMENKSLYGGAPRCNAGRKVLECWLEEIGLIVAEKGKEKVGVPKETGGKERIPQKGKTRIVTFDSLFPVTKYKDEAVYSLSNVPEYPGLDIDYYPAYLTKVEGKAIVEHIFDLTFYPKRQFNRYAKPARVTSSSVYYAWFSDLPDAIYNFSKSHLNGFTPQPFTASLNQLRERIKETTGVYYNSLLINLYKDGKSALSAHSDDSKWLGTDFDVPSLSFGEARDIIFRPKNPNSDAIKLLMASESLTVMKGRSTQELWTHEIPARANKKWRINLTFRDVKEDLISLNPRVQNQKEMKIAKQEAKRPQELVDIRDFY